MGFITPKDEAQLTELFIGGVPIRAAIVQIEQLIEEKVGEALREHGVFDKE